jgi:hypothetical protein
MKRTLLALVVVLGLVGLTSAPAGAVYHGQSCGGWNHAGTTITACVITNQSDIQPWQLEGLLRFQRSNSQAALSIEIDYIRLKRNGITVKARENNSTYIGVTVQPNWNHQSTGWNGCATGTVTYTTTARYRLFHQTDGHGVWVTRTSAGWTASCS